MTDTTDPELILYHFPGACSQVAVCALEMTGLPYRLELVDLPGGQQNTAEYTALNSLAKVPYLLVDGVGLSENMAILTYLAALRPDSGVFPVPSSPRDRAEVVSGLSFCSATLHPIVRGMLNPARLTSGDTEGVRDMAMTLGRKAFGHAEARLVKRGWWLGEPCIVDVYLNWARSVATRGGFDFAGYPQLSALPQRLRQIPGFIAMLREEEASTAKLADRAAAP